MAKLKSAYRSYLLRLWRLKESNATWRVMLVEVKTGETRQFSSLDKAIRFLKEQVNEDRPQPGPNSE
jgi:hypothetical protein